MCGHGIRGQLCDGRAEPPEFESEYSGSGPYHVGRQGARVSGDSAALRIQEKETSSRDAVIGGKARGKGGWLPRRCAILAAPSSQ